MMCVPGLCTLQRAAGELLVAPRGELSLKNGTGRCILVVPDTVLRAASSRCQLPAARSSLFAVQAASCQLP